MTLAELERNVAGTLSLALIAGHQDPDRFHELGGNASMLLAAMQDAGGLAALVERCAAEQAAEHAAMDRRKGGA